MLKSIIIQSLFLAVMADNCAEYYPKKGYRNGLDICTRNGRLKMPNKVCPKGRCTFDVCCLDPSKVTNCAEYYVKKGYRNGLDICTRNGKLKVPEKECPKGKCLFDVCCVSPSSSIKIIAVGDIGVKGSDRDKVLKAIGKEAKDNGITDVLNLGDNFYKDKINGKEYDEGIQSVKSKRWDYFFDAVDKYIPTSKSLIWHTALGNHDYDGDKLSVAQNQIIGSYNWDNFNLPDHVYTITKKQNGISVKIIGFDSEAVEEGITVKLRSGKKLSPSGQRKWIEKEIKNAPSDAWIIVMGHHTYYSVTRGSTYLEDIRDMLLKYKQVSLVLSGHDHSLEAYQMKSNQWNIVSGSGAKTRKPRIDSKEEDEFKKDMYKESGIRLKHRTFENGFVLLDISKNNIKVELKEVTKDDGTFKTVYTVNIERP